MWRDGADAVKRVMSRPRTRSKNERAAAFFADAERADVRMRSASDLAMLLWVQKGDFVHEQDVPWSRVPYGVSSRQTNKEAYDAWRRLCKLAPAGLPFRETIERVLVEVRGDFQALLLAEPSSWATLKSEDQDIAALASSSAATFHASDETVDRARRKRLKRKLKRAKKQGDTVAASRLRKKLAKLKSSAAGPAPEPEPEPEESKRKKSETDSDDEINALTSAVISPTVHKRKRPRGAR